MQGAARIKGAVMAALVMFFIGGIFIAVSSLIGGTYKGADEIADYESTYGIISYREEKDSDGDWMYRQIVDFEVDGSYYTWESNMLSSSKSHKYTDGDTVKVMYDAYNPWHNSVPELEESEKSFLSIFRIIGIAVIALGILIIIKPLLKLLFTVILVGGRKQHMQAPETYWNNAQPGQNTYNPQGAVDLNKNNPMQSNVVQSSGVQQDNNGSNYFDRYNINQ